MRKLKYLGTILSLETGPDGIERKFPYVIQIYLAKMCYNMNL